MTFVITMSLVDGAWGLKAEVRLLIQFCVFVSENSDGSATHDEGPSVRPEPYAASSPATEFCTPFNLPSILSMPASNPPTYASCASARRQDARGRYHDRVHRARLQDAGVVSHSSRSFVRALCSRV